MQVHRIGLSAAAQPEARAVCPELDGVCIEIRLAAAAVRDPGTGHFAVQSLAVFVICINNGSITPLEQQFLCLVIVFHRAVIIQVILGQIGERSCCEMGLADALLHQTERGHLHDHIVTSCLCHSGIQRHQIIDERGGIVRVDNLVSDLVLDRADQSHLVSVFRQNVLDEIGDGGLAVGSGDADETHLPLRMTEPCGAELSVERTGVLCQDLPVAQPQVVVSQHRCRTTFQHVFRRRVSVKAFSTDAGEQHSRLYLSGIVCQSGDLHIRQTGFRIVFQKRI